MILLEAFITGLGVFLGMALGAAIAVFIGALNTGVGGFQP